MSDEPRKRSRFDQSEPVSVKKRLDRRSRSPEARDVSNGRSRSPQAGSTPQSPPNAGASNAKALAAAAAAKINAQLAAQLQSQKAAQPAESQIRSPATAGSAKSPGSDANKDKDEIYQKDGDYIKDIEINDLRNRYTITKGSTQKLIKDETGADVTTRGNYYPDKSMATASHPPLYLHVTSTSKEGLEKAVKKIDELLKQELPNLIDERRFKRREPEQFERDEHGRRKWPEEKIPIDLEPIPGFNLRAQVVGHQGAYVKHIQSETRCRVQIKGRGSGYTERGTEQESDEPMYLHVAGPDPNEVQRAKKLAEDLLGEVRNQYQEFKARGPRMSQGGGGYGRNNDGYGRGGGGGYGQQQQQPQQQQYGGYGAAAAQPQASETQAADFFAQYQQWYASGAQNPYPEGQDPYSAYGGYPSYMHMWYQHYMSQAGYGQQGQDGYQQQYQQQGYDQQYQQSSEVPPPPPPPPPPGASGEGSPPPPPPPGAPPGTDGYGAVPPPPGV